MLPMDEALCIPLWVNSYKKVIYQLLILQILGFFFLFRFPLLLYLYLG